MQAANVHVNRFILNWVWVEPTKDHFDWGSSDRFIGELASRGIRALPSVWGNPDWVAGGAATPPTGGTNAQQQWRNLLKALVNRYGPGGDYWATKYHQQFGAAAVPLPITAWQIWNEPNVKKFFTPYPSPGQYARLLQISTPTIKSIDPRAQVGLAGMPGYGDVTAWDFLKKLYAVGGIKAFFDAAAIHPYAKDLTQFKQEIQRTRNVITGHNDAATPLWISELAWGSAPPDSHGINKGPTGQAKMLTRALQAGARQPDRLERAAPLLVPLARPEALPRVVQLLRQRGPAQLQPHPEAGAEGIQDLHHRQGHAQGDDHGGAGPGKHDRRPDADLQVHLEQGRFDLPLQVRREAVPGVRLALTRRRRPSRTVPTPSP